MTGGPPVAAAVVPPVEAAIAGYLSGHVPYGLADEIVWRVPTPRFHLDLAYARFPRDVWSRTSHRGWSVRINSDFAQVVRRCADTPRADTTQWLTPALISLYTAMHTAGLACSFEVWDGADLVGGEFGVIASGAYFCESKFHRASGAGNLSTGAAVLTLADAGFSVYDAQYGPDYLRRYSTGGLKPFDADYFPTALARAAAKRFQHFCAGGPVELTTPVLPR